MNYIRWFGQPESLDISLVGGKNASLARMIQDLSSHAVSIPSGFAVTTGAYWEFLDAHQLRPELARIIQTMSPDATWENIAHAGKQARSVILSATMPVSISSEITRAYAELSHRYEQANLPVAVRSSASAEDLPTASFAGQQESFLHVTGSQEVVQACQRCFASLFTDRAIAYRIRMGFDHLAVALSAGVQKMVLSSGASAGVGFSLDVQTGFDKVVMIEASYGLGEAIVKGAVVPDTYTVYKTVGPDGLLPILNKQLGSKTQKVVFQKNKTEMVPVPSPDQGRFCLNNAYIQQIASAIIAIEAFYSTANQHKTPMDVEWAIDEQDQKLYIVQARPETVHAQERKKELKLTQYRVQPPAGLMPLAYGVAIGRQAYTGVAQVIDRPEGASIQEGQIIVTRMSDPDWLPLLKQAGGIITELGGRTCHAAIVARELGIPAVVGVEQVTKLIQSGTEITIDCTQGQRACIYPGSLPVDIEQDTFDIGSKVLRDERIMVSLSDPGQSYALSALPIAGVGLTRLEFVVAHEVGVHPLALIHVDTIADQDVVQQIRARSSAYKSPIDMYVDRLSFAIATIAAAFSPRPVIIRCTDFKSNEYRQLLGGSLFEPEEKNPMLGFRGTSRYLDSQFRPAFDLECQAIERVVAQMGFDNIILLVPFVRTVKEAEQVRGLLKINRLDPLVPIYMMVEVPSNVLQAEEFCEQFDGFSIGSNDLTQLVLGVDRDSARVAYLFSEMDQALRLCYERVIAVAKQHGKPIGFCGQAPSDDSNCILWLLNQGIDSISVSPDAALSILARKDRS